MKIKLESKIAIFAIVLIFSQIGSVSFLFVGNVAVVWGIILQSISLITSVIFMLFLFFVLRSNQRKLNLVKQTLTNAVKGDLRFDSSLKNRLKKTNDADQILLSVIELLNIFQDIITLLKGATQGLTSSISNAKLADEAFHSNLHQQQIYSQNLDSTVRKMTENMANIADASGDNYDTLTRVSESIKILSEHINYAEENSSHSRSLTSGISSKIEKGNLALEEMTRVIDSIAESSGKIEGMVVVIKEISDRVNLLALNASIEAARAGEYGSGFAVVAQEVSKLASQTAKSIKEIDSNVKRNKEEVILNKLKINETSQLYREIISEVNQIIERISSISDSVSTQSKIKETLIGESNKLSQMLAEINQTIADQNVSQKLIADVASAMDSAVNATSAEGDNLSKLLEKIKTTSDDIGGVVLLFK
ncbi:hypothetical protein LPTSP3_g28560 [Leptospira kobayashii]|uniref:Methyl-accepting transducer domain-containing protein n=1 Tax=Leptospira kobayashii TaxID=1917830 RepID=A0ABM7UT91_9LEPT|nr:methyl-accepting chemotaxis protein [Leptospira kobayashii]BDA79926.1 hypothetical protein LPTSP3_g28560 [Leptospira kobayashii]